MATELEMEDEELYDSEATAEAEDEEAEDDEAEDEERGVAMYRPFPTPMPGWSRPGAGPYSGMGVSPARQAARIKGVRNALIRGRDGATAVVRLPSAVATVQGVQQLGRRSAQAELILAHHERRLRALRSGESRVRTTITGAVILQHLRDVISEARAAAATPAAGWAPVWNPILAGADYTLSVTQTGFTVAAIPASRRSAPFWTLPFTSGLVASLGRETLRAPVGLNVPPVPPPAAGAPAPAPPIARGKRLWPDSVLAVGIPALVGAVASYVVRPGRPSRLRR